MGRDSARTRRCCRVDDARCRRWVMPHPASGSGCGGLRRRESRPAFARDPDRDPGAPGRRGAAARGGDREPSESRSLRGRAGDHGTVSDGSAHRESCDAGRRRPGSGWSLGTTAGLGDGTRGPDRGRNVGSDRSPRRGPMDMASSRSGFAIRRRQRWLAGDPRAMAGRRTDLRRRARGRPRDRGRARPARTKDGCASRPRRTSPPRLVAAGRRGMDRVHGTVRGVPVDRTGTMAARSMGRGLGRIGPQGDLHRRGGPGPGRPPRSRIGRTGHPPRTLDAGRMVALRDDPARS